jgi:hypothetical protein
LQKNKLPKWQLLRKKRKKDLQGSRWRLKPYLSNNRKSLKRDLREKRKRKRKQHIEQPLKKGNEEKLSLK